MFNVSIGGFSANRNHGNSGSGKSWLAGRLSHNLSVPAIDLDLIYWRPGGHDGRREKSLAMKMVRQASKGEGWVIEGVYGGLARKALPNATALIWLDVADDDCIANLKQRGLQGWDETVFSALLIWAGEYRVRDNSASFAGHERIFLAFPGPKVVLRSRNDMEKFLERIGVARA